nr:unnamed protein product [Spirometra erinaceieuropaei]
MTAWSVPTRALKSLRTISLSAFSERQAEARQAIVEALRHTGQSYDAVPDGKGDARVPSLYPEAAAPEEGIAGISLLQLNLFGEPALAECSNGHLVARQLQGH